GRGAVVVRIVCSALLVSCAPHLARPVRTEASSAGIEGELRAVPHADTTERRYVAWTRGPDASSSVAPGEIAGVVVDAENGTPLEQTMVAIIAPGGTTYTDSLGRFRLRVPAIGAKLRVMRIGYAYDSLNLQGRTDSGLVATFALRSKPLRLCPVFVGSV